mmetsp:Transcript_75505/g.233583  ORF Transcript_75505/g.233583 Transcript_75505/m.233583 type:complete len:239 (+) Transcript_75505:553-1269(+)
MEVRRRVHPLVHVLLLDVRMPIEVDDADPLGGNGGQASDCGEANGVVSPEDYGESAAGGNVAHSVADLIEGLLYVCGDGKDVAHVAERHLLPEVHGHLVIVGRVESGDLADALRPKARAGPVGGAAVKGRADDRGVVEADVLHVLDVGSLHEGVDACEVRQLPARHHGDVAVLDGAGRLQAQLFGTFNLRCPPVGGQLGLLLGCAPARRFAELWVVMVAMAMKPGPRGAAHGAQGAPG